MADCRGAFSFAGIDFLARVVLYKKATKGGKLMKHEDITRWSWVSPAVVAGGVIMGGVVVLDALFCGASQGLMFAPWASDFDKAMISQLTISRSIVLTTMVLGVGMLLLRLCKCKEVGRECLFGGVVAIAKLYAVALLARPLALLICRPIGVSCSALMEPVRALNDWTLFHVISILILAMTLILLIWILNHLEKKVLALRSFVWRIALGALIVLSAGTAIVALRHGSSSSGGGEERRQEERMEPAGEEYRLSGDEPGMVYA